MKKIYSRIKSHQASFTKGLQKVGVILMNEPKVIALHSASEVGNKIGVSETTIIRFSHQLGYSGYKELQKDVQKSLFNKSSLSNYLDDKLEIHSDTHVLKNLLKKDINNIIKIMEQVSEEEINKVVSTLSDANQILVCGLQSSYALANWFTFALDLVIGKTSIYHSNFDNILLRFSELTSRSTLVVFSFHRYATETIKIAKLAQQQGVHVIAFTDSSFSPVTAYANQIISVSFNEKSTLDAVPAMFALMNSIISKIIIENQSIVKDRMNQIDFMDNVGLFTIPDI